jgi:hypothetical protein
MIDSLSTAVTGHKRPTPADIEQRSHELITEAGLHSQHQTVPASQGQPAPQPEQSDQSYSSKFIRQTEFIRQNLFVRRDWRQNLFVKNLFVRRDWEFIRQTGLGLFRRSFLRIEGELAFPLIWNNLLAGSSLLYR